MMYASVELRWFLPEKPSQIADWFRTMRKPFCQVEKRTDYYLDMDGRTDISFKMREGRAELKMRIGALGSHTFFPTVTGSLEKWVKWTPTLKKGLTIPGQVFDPSVSFAQVAKHRQLIIYEPIPGKGFSPTPKGQKDYTQACQVELTEIQLGDKTLYSFGLEAFGAAEQNSENLKIVAAAIFRDLGSISLPASSSYGYPTLLASSPG